MARYAELYFSDKEVGRYQSMILRWRPRLKYEDETIWGIQGEKIELPMTYTDYRQMPLKIRDKVFKKIEKQLKKRTITHVLIPRLMGSCPFEDISESRGSHIKPFFMMELIGFIIDKKLIGKDLQDIEVVILDGDEKEVDMLIDLIYPYINHLTIVTKNPERFKQKEVDIFDDVGLNMQVLSYTKGAISQGDIIIDTHYYDPGIIRLCKAKSVYLDMGSNSEKTVMLIESQREVLVIDQFLLEKNNEVVSLAKAEMLLKMNKVFSRNYKETMKRLKKENIKVYKLAN